MKIVLIDPGKKAEIVDRACTLEEMQKTVGGTIQAIYPFDDGTALVCNDDGKVSGLPANRGIKDEVGDLTNIICGTFFVVGCRKNDFCSLTDEQAEYYRDKFLFPEKFYKDGDKIVSIQYATF